jgi:hypothetical protein
MENKKNPNNQLSTSSLVSEFQYLIKSLYFEKERNDQTSVTSLINQLRKFSKDYYIDLINLEENLFIEVATLLSINESDPETALTIRSQYTKCLKETFGGDSLILSDYCKATSFRHSLFLFIVTLRYCSRHR